MDLKTFDSVLCFGDSDWWYHNRGHADMQFMRRFARHWPVVYVNSLGVVMPRVSDRRMFFRRMLRKMGSMTRYWRDGGEGFAVLSPIYAPVRNGLFGRALLRTLAIQIESVLRISGMRRPLIWVACPTAARVVHRIRGAGIVYQLSDCYGALNGERTFGAAAAERTLADRATLVLCSSGRLFERARHLYRKGEYVDHGVDFELFATASRHPICPKELRGAKRPIIGFFGNIDANTVDKQLLAEVIRLRPQYTFALVGSMADDFLFLRRFHNVLTIPRQPYRSIPQFGAAFDVCLMPWLQNDWIEHCNPIKLKEYLALGKPVVTTPFPELRSAGSLCYEAIGPESFASAIDRALDEDARLLGERRQAWAAQHSWDTQFGRVLALLHEKGIGPDER